MLTVLGPLLPWLTFGVAVWLGVDRWVWGQTIKSQHQENVTVGKASLQTQIDALDGHMKGIRASVDRIHEKASDDADKVQVLCGTLEVNVAVLTERMAAHERLPIHPGAASSAVFEALEHRVSRLEQVQNGNHDDRTPSGGYRVKR